MEEKRKDFNEPETTENKPKKAKAPIIRYKCGTTADQLIKGSKAAAGYDIAYTGKEIRTLQPKEIAVLETGLCMELPDNIEAQIRTRSSMAMEGIIVLNSPGTIDPDYTGEIKVILMNVSDKKYEVVPNQRIAQVVFSRVLKISFGGNAADKKTHQERYRWIRINRKVEKEFLALN